MTDKISAKINAIRQKAGNPMTKCPTCCRAAGAPFRVFDVYGKIINGCIDPFHTDHLPHISESSRWHNTKAAQSWRREMLVNLISR